MKSKVCIGFAATLVIAVLSSCSPSQPASESNLTSGMVTLTIEKGKTDQARVLEVFGPPDQVTHRDDKQIWTYDKVRYRTRVSAGTLIFYEAASRTSESVSTLLILYFNDEDTVYDYRFDTYRF
jgi:hypothetical protein